MRKRTGKTFFEGILPALFAFAVWLFYFTHPSEETEPVLCTL